MKTLYTRLLIALLSAVSLQQATAQTLMPLPPHSSVYTGTVRGYWFTAPTNFTITGLKVDAQAGAGDQFIHLMKINDPTPVLFATTSSNFTTLAYISNAPNNVVQTVNVQVTAGDIIGVLGCVGTNTANSYSASGTPFASNINGLPISLGRLLYQGGLTVPAPNYSTEGNGTPISRVEMYYTVGVECSTVALNTAVVMGPDQVCPNKNFDLSVGLASGLKILGLTVKWETSLNNANWSPFTGTVAPNGVLTDMLTTSGKYYRCTITCTATGQSFTTPSKYVALSPFYYCYCEGSKATSSTGGDIGNVTVRTFPGNKLLMNNGTATPLTNNANANKAYTDLRYTVPPIPMYRDSAYLLNLTQINSAAYATAKASVFIDFNRNGTFDMHERVTLQQTTNSIPTPNLVVDTINVSADTNITKVGITGMRVILRTGTGDPDSCANYPDGETEDYLVDLRYVPCEGKPDAGTITGDTSMCVGYEYTLTDSTYTKQRYGIVNSWDISADAVNWTPLANTANKDTVTRAFYGQPLYYRLKSVCTITGDTTTSEPHKVNLKPAFKCYCFSQAIGRQQDTSDIGAFAIDVFNVNTGGTHLQNALARYMRSDYTDIRPTEMNVDSAYNMYVYHTMPGKYHADAKVTIFIDFDNDGIYEPPYERVYMGFTDVNTHTLVKNVLIPDGVITNVPTGMRVILNNNLAPNAASDDGCGTYQSGETEDYMIIFKKPFPADVADVAALSDVQLAPNPTQGKFNVMFSSNSTATVQVRIVTVTGQLISAQTYNHTGGRFVQELDMAGKAKGVYFVELEANGRKTKHKLVLQ